MSKKKMRKKKSSQPGQSTHGDELDHDNYCPVKVDLVHRLLAKFIDFLIFSALLVILPSFVGFLAGVTYILIADGLNHGQSLGKKWIGVKVVANPAHQEPKPCDFKKSITRNLPFAFIAFLNVFHFLGFLIFLVGLVFVVFETYFIFTDDQGVRLGDIFANTKVLDA